MRRWIDHRPSGASVIALIALIAALSGTAYAATLIGTKQLKDGAVTGVAVSHGLDTHVITDRAAFDAIRPEWDALVLASPRPTPFLLQPWLAAWWSLYRPDSLIRCITVRDGDRLVAALPLAILRRGRVRVGEMAGSLALADAPVAGADPRAAAVAFRAAIEREPLDLIDFDYLAPDCMLATCLPGSLRVTYTRAAPSMEMPDGWEAAY